ncbi:hypothetical protein L9F63_016564, partial [Diploptera punctata]
SSSTARLTISINRRRTETDVVDMRQYNYEHSLSWPLAASQLLKSALVTIISTAFFPLLPCFTIKHVPSLFFQFSIPKVSSTHHSNSSWYRLEIERYSEEINAGSLERLISSKKAIHLNNHSTRKLYFFLIRNSYKLKKTYCKVFFHKTLKDAAHFCFDTRTSGIVR